MSGESVFPTDGISVEVTENTLMDEASNCCHMGFSISNSDKEMQIHNPDIDANGNSRDSDVVIKDMVSDKLSAETYSTGFLLEASDDKHSRDLTLHSDINELFVRVANDASTMEGSYDLDVIAISPLRENNSEAEEAFSSVEEHNMGSSEENVNKYQKLISPLHVGCVEQSCALDGDTYLSQSGDINTVTPEIESRAVNESVDRAVVVVCSSKKLLVLDVNGLLADISSYVPYDYDPDEILCRKAVFKRPHCDDFLKFCFERFNVGVWSSRTRRNMEPIIDFLLGNDKNKMLFHWDQSHCTYTGFNTIEKRHKPLLLKKLKKLWNKYEPDLPWERGVYNESNTLLIDDSPYKALCNPPYTAIFPYTYGFRDVRDNSLGHGGDLRVYLERLAMAENVQEFVKQNPFGQRPITEKNLSWGYYRKIIEASSSPQRETAEDSYIQLETRFRS